MCEGLLPPGKVGRVEMDGEKLEYLHSFSAGFIDGPDAITPTPITSRPVDHPKWDPP